MWVLDDSHRRCLLSPILQLRFHLFDGQAHSGLRRFGEQLWRHRVQHARVTFDSTTSAQSDTQVQLLLCRMWNVVQEQEREVGRLLAKGPLRTTNQMFAVLSVRVRLQSPFVFAIPSRLGFVPNAIACGQTALFQIDLDVFLSFIQSILFWLFVINLFFYEFQNEKKINIFLI